MAQVLGFRCKDCNEPLSDFEADLVELFEGMCEECFEKNCQARQDIIPDDVTEEDIS